MSVCHVAIRIQVLHFYAGNAGFSAFPYVDVCVQPVQPMKEYQT